MHQHVTGTAPKLSLARIEARISEVASNIFGPENVSLNILGQFFIYRELIDWTLRAKSFKNAI